MKKKIVAVMLVLVLTFSVVTIASAVGYSATKCQIGFTSDGSLNKPSGSTWSGVDVYANSITFTPSKSSKYLKAKPVTPAGVGGGTQTRVNAADSVVISISSAHDQTPTIKLRIDNPYSGTNMVCSGSFYAVYA